MENINTVACPVCTLYLRPGMTLENHLKSHPKQKVIEALIRVTELGPQNDKINTECSQNAPGMTVFSPMNQVPTNHSFIYQQFMSSSGTQPILNVNPMNQQFVAVPTVFNPQMICSPYIYQQQQQLQIVSGAGNIQPFIPRPNSDLFPSSNSTICCTNDTDVTDPLDTSVRSSSPKSSVNSVKNESVREINNDKVSTISSFNSSDNSNEEQQSVDEVRADIIIETITDVASDENKNVHKDKDELNKACQTVTEIEPHTASESEPTNNVGDIVLIASENEIFHNETVHLSSNNVFQAVEQNVPSSSGLQNNVNVTVLEMEDINFILPNDFIPNGQSVLSKEIECIEDVKNDRPQVIMSIDESTIANADILLDISEEKCIIGTSDIDDKCLEEKVDDEGLSRESLNIRADERMPPRGELSEQESNGASEVGWGSRIYQEGSSGMSTSYDLLARESWEASDCSDSEIAPLQSRIEIPADYNQEDEIDTKSEQLDDDDKPVITTFICSICGDTFRCPKERRVHQAKEHAASSSNAAKKIFKKKNIRSNLRKDKVDTKLDVLVKNEPKCEPQENEEAESDSKNDFESTGIKENVLCNTCGELLPSIRELNIHNKKVHNIRPPNKNLSCKTCSKKFSTQRQYTEHLKEHPLECNICAKHFYKVPNLRLHLKRHSGIRPHKCDYCSKTFFVRQKLREHINIHTGQSPIKCSMCDETFRRYSNLIQHRNNHHLNIKKKIRDYICHCGEIYHSKSKLNWHKETHEAKPKSCKYCHEKFIHMASLTRHIRRAHNQRYVPEVTRENENVECKICKGIYLKSSLEAHLHTHSGKKQHSCTICSKGFSTKWNLKLHKWTHAAPASKPFRCEVCQSAFIRQSDYTSHMNSHRSIRPYTCNYCGCKFIRKYNCLRHVREHEEGKAYVCNVCNKSFHRSYYLKEHMRVHSGVRPFSCHICGKTSTTKSNHNKHMKIHHAREPVMTEG